jgi:hypothetical protein
MRRAITRIMIILSVAGTLTATAQLTSPTLTHAQGVILPTPVCDANAYCMNDWYDGGLGTSVKMFTPQSSANEDFAVIQLDDRCGGTVTLTCPFTNHAFDTDEEFAPVVEILDTSNGLCVSTNTSNGTAILGNCPVDGSGGSPGNIFVYDESFESLISNYWTNQDDSLEGIDATDDDGGTIYLWSAYATLWTS